MKNIKKYYYRIPNIIRARLPLIIFLIIFILYALHTYRSFGITWDETDVYTWGKANIEYYLLKPNHYNFTLLSNLEGFYYNFYASILVAISYIVKHANSIYLFHFLNFIFAIPIFIFAYEVLLKKYKNQLLAILGPIFLILTPRFFNDIAANPKDVPFAVVMFSALALIYLVFKKDVFTKVLVLGIAFGFTQSFRVLGFDIYFVYVAYILYNYFVDNKFNKKEFISYLIKEIKVLILIMITAFALMYATWPAVGANAIGGFKTAIELPKTFGWNGNVLFNGETINYRHLPDAYLPVWYIISTPVFILALLASCLVIIKRLYKNRIFFLFAFAFVMNIFLYFILDPVIYNGMRHFLFLYPIGSILAVFAFIEIVLWSKKTKFKYKKLLIGTISGLIILNILTVLINYINLFPYGYIYFNELVGGLPGASKLFETDYWATGTKEAIEWLNVNTPNDVPIGVSSLSYPNQIQYYMKSNMVYYPNESRKEALYYIAWDANALKSTKGEVVYTVQREGVNLMYVMKFEK